MSYVYHGSKTQGLTMLIPHKSTHGIYVYASKSKSINSFGMIEPKFHVREDNKKIL